LEPPKPPIASIPAADVAAPLSTVGTIVHQSFSVKQPAEDSAEFIMHVRASSLRRARTKLAQLAHARFPWPELLLGLATLALGATLGAIPAKLEFGSPLGIFFYTAMPVLGCSGLVAYLFLRRSTLVDVHLIANEALSEIPDPVRAIGQGNSNEHL
jgi:hypothetical protein